MENVALTANVLTRTVNVVSMENVATRLAKKKNTMLNIRLNIKLNAMIKNVHAAPMENAVSMESAPTRTVNVVSMANAAIRYAKKQNTMLNIKLSTKLSQNLATRKKFTRENVKRKNANNKNAKLKIAMIKNVSNKNAMTKLNTKKVNLAIKMKLTKENATKKSANRKNVRLINATTKSAKHKNVMMNTRPRAMEKRRQSAIKLSATEKRKNAIKNVRKRSVTRKLNATMTKEKKERKAETPLTLKNIE